MTSSQHIKIKSSWSTKTLIRNCRRTINSSCSKFTMPQIHIQIRTFSASQEVMIV